MCLLPWVLTTQKAITKLTFAMVSSMGYWICGKIISESDCILFFSYSQANIKILS